MANVPGDSANKAAAAALTAQAPAIAHAVIERMFHGKQSAPGLVTQRRLEYCLEDCLFHIKYVSQAVATGRHELLKEYLTWARTLLISYNVPPEDLTLQMQQLSETLADHLPEPEHVALIRDSISRALDQVDLVNSGSALASPAANILTPLAQGYMDALLGGDRRQALAIILAAADGGTDIKCIYLDVFQPVQREIGRLWHYNKISVAQEHYCTAVTQHAMAQLYPRLFQGDRNGRVVVAASVAGELHELGIRMVSDFFEMHGWDSFYLGASTPVSGIISMVEERQAHLLALSATITPNVGQVAKIIQHVRRECIRDVKIMVGGYPFNVAPDLWREIGADCYAQDAASAIAQAEAIVQAPGHD